MTSDDIIRMARELGCDIPSGPEGVEFFFYPTELERFASLVAAAEREACAKVCESEGARIDAGWASCAAAIRARGQGNG